MSRTTVDIDAPLLRDLKRLQRVEKKTLGKLMSELLAQALDARQKRSGPTSGFKWVARSMGTASVDLRDKEAVWSALDEPGGSFKAKT
jgi:hypothetical protein